MNGRFGLSKYTIFKLAQIVRKTYNIRYKLHFVFKQPLLFGNDYFSYKKIITSTIRFVITNFEELL